MIVDKIWIYTTIGIAFSLFYGLKAVTIFVDTGGAIYLQKKDILSWRLHQFWINFIGSSIGWTSLGYMIFVRYGNFGNYDITDIAIFIVAIIGITGYLPYTISKTSGLK